MKPSKFLAAVAAAGAMLVGLVGLAGTARAQRWDACSARVQKDQQDLDRAIDRFGYNSGPAQHERGELQRDAANCGYGDGRYDRDRDGWRYGNDGGYHQGYRDYNSPSDYGYRDGVAMGQRDAQRNRPFRPNKNDWYEDADRGYTRAYGDKNFYKRQYREAFEQGYSEGYRRWR